MSRTHRWIMAACICVFSFAIFGAAPAASAQSFSVLYNFGNASNDPDQGFYSGVIVQGQDGNLYSGTSAGGAFGAGATFNLSPAGILTPLYSFADNGDGESPFGGLTMGTDGNFYGTTYSGTVGNPRYGTIFKMTPGGDLTTLYSFTDGGDGATPFSPPVEGTDGNFYGTTSPWNGAVGQGAIYKITPSGTFTILYQFDGTHGSIAVAPLILGSDGNFYGTTIYGGTSGGSCGVVFKITPAGQLTVLHNLDNLQGDGEFPVGRLVQGNDGNFYGTTLDGGAYGYGVVFKITPAGQFTVLHDMNPATDGGAPYAGMVQATDGNFYGANATLGAPSTNCPGGCGTIFKITPSGDFSVVYNFDQTTGQLPYSTLFQHTNGMIYGMTQLGGTGNAGPYCGAPNCGVVYSLNISAAPFVAFVLPTGKTGSIVEILGQGFTGTTGVSFNGMAASFTVVSDTYLTATVPGRATTGSVTVSTPGGTLTSNVPFRVLGQKLFSTTTQVSTSGSPSTINQPVTFTATVTSTSGSIPDGESVTFFDGSTQIGLGTTSTGVATFTTSALAAKTHTIKATYSGDATFKTSSGTVTQVVQLYATSVALAGGPDPSSFGESVQLVATVTNSGGPMPTGTVTFKNGTTTLGSGTLNSSGSVTLFTTKLPVGTDFVTAAYNGDSQNAKSTSPNFTQIVNQATISIVVTSLPNPSKNGKPVKFTATLSSTGSLPSGQVVTFSYNGATLGTGIIASGKAVFSTTTLPIGADEVTASYAGDANYTSASNFTTQSVN